MAMYVIRGVSNCQIEINPDDDVMAGDIVVVDDVVAVAIRDIPADTDGIVERGRIYGGAPKDTSEALTKGTVVYYDVNEKVFTETSGEDTVIGGVVVADAAASDSTFEVFLG